jgi:hypothetical protein
MEYIDLYVIHDAVFANRAECNECPSLMGSGIDAECVQMNESKHLACPFVEEISLEAESMNLDSGEDLLIEFIEEVMELDLSPEDKVSFNTGDFFQFIGNNLDVFNQKLTDFFSKRVSNDNNYRSVLRV